MSAALPLGFDDERAEVVDPGGGFDAAFMLAKPQLYNRFAQTGGSYAYR